MARSGEVAVRVSNVSKTFKLPHEKQNSIKGLFVNMFRRKRTYEKQQVLKDISLEVKKGEFFGIVGRNGSGKSTLLKLLAGIYTQDSGNIEVNGKLVPFIELGVGFNPELTGRENIFLNGALLGFSRKEMDSMYDDIVEFAELEKFMDQKLKNYSSGMQVRLAFSIAIRAQGDILVLDEVLAVGDEAFQRKCNEYFDKIKKDDTKTIILVTHGMDSVRKYCDRAVMIRDGRIIVDGSPEDIANEYSLENTVSTAESDDGEFTKGTVENIKVKLLSPRKISEKEMVEVRVGYRMLKDQKTRILLNLLDMDRQVPLYAGSTELISARAGDTVTKTFRMALTEINNTNLKIAMTIRDEDNEVVAFPQQNTLPAFIVRRSDYKSPLQKNKIPYAILHNRGEWQ